MNLKQKRTVLIFLFFLSSVFSFSYLQAAERLAVEKSMINIRSGPGTDYEILWKAELNYPLEIIEKKDNWLRFRDFEGYEGWVSKNLVGSTPSVIVKNMKANVRQGPGTDNPIVFTVEKGVPFRVMGRQGVWIRVRHADGDEGWIHQSLVW